MKLCYKDWGNALMTSDVTVPEAYDYAMFDARVLAQGTQTGTLTLGPNTKLIAYVWVLHCHDPATYTPGGQFVFYDAWNTVSAPAAMTDIAPRWISQSGGPDLYWVDPTLVQPSAYVDVITSMLPQVDGLFLDFLWDYHPTERLAAKRWQLEFVAEIRRRWRTAHLIGNGPWTHFEHFWTLGLNGMYLEKLGQPWNRTAQEIKFTLDLPHEEIFIDPRPGRKWPDPDQALAIGEWLAEWAGADKGVLVHNWSGGQTWQV